MRLFVLSAAERGCNGGHTCTRVLIEDWLDNAYIINILATGLVYGMMRWPVQVSYRFHEQ